MEVTNEKTKELIDELIGKNTVLGKKLLNLNPDAIRSLAECNYNIPSEEEDKYIAIHSYKEPNMKIKKLYLMLVDEYYKKKMEDLEETIKISTK